MKIPIKELATGKGYITYDTGFRIVYYYENHHEVLKGIWANEIIDFMKEFKENNKIPKFKSLEDILNKFLERNKDALAVAIYKVSGELVIRKEKKLIKNTINQSEVYKEELIYDYGIRSYDEGYRLVSFYDNKYHVGDYSKTLEGFMRGLADYAPLIDEHDIPKFKSIDDILERTLKLSPTIDGVALYKIDGTCLASKTRDDLTRKKNY